MTFAPSTPLAQVVHYTVDGSNTWDYLGSSVAGRPDFVVGAPGADDDRTWSERAFIRSGIDGSPYLSMKGEDALFFSGDGNADVIVRGPPRRCQRRPLWRGLGLLGDRREVATGLARTPA